MAQMTMSGDMPICFLRTFLTSKRHIFLHKYKDALPLISELQGQLQAFVFVS